ncbi:MAG: hypothetical protein V7L20_02705 [Nostoc sp.]
MFLVRAIALSQYPLLWMNSNKAQWLKILQQVERSPSLEGSTRLDS